MILRHFLFFALLCFGLPGSAQEACFDLFQKPLATAPSAYDEYVSLYPMPRSTEQGPSMSYAMMFLAAEGRLLGQLDPILMPRKLLQPNGGLCASTCIVNVVRTFHEYHDLSIRAFEVAPDFKIQKIMDYVRETHNYDARYGMDLITAADVINKAITHYDRRLVIEAEYRSYNLNERSLQNRHNSLHMVSVQAGSPDMLHAIVILNIIPSQQTLTYFDPNFPQHFFTRHYETVHHPQYGETLEIYHGYGQSGRGVITNAVEVTGYLAP